MLNKRIIDKKRWVLFWNFEFWYLFLKSIIMCQLLPRSYWFFVQSFFFNNIKISWNASCGRIWNRCVITGWGRGIVRSFKVSWITLWNLCSLGLINGIWKASW